MHKCIHPSSGCNNCFVATHHMLLLFVFVIVEKPTWQYLTYISRHNTLIYVIGELKCISLVLLLTMKYSDDQYTRNAQCLYTIETPFNISRKLHSYLMYDQESLDVRLSRDLAS